MTDYLSALPFFSFVDEFAFFEGKCIEVLSVDVEFAAFVAQIIVFYIFVLFFLFGFGNVGRFFEGFLICEADASKCEGGIGAEFFDHKFSFLGENCGSALEGDFKDVEMYFSVVGDAPAYHNFQQCVDVSAFEAVVHEEEIVD